MASKFKPTHEITAISNGVSATELVQLVDGAAYTREEWDSETGADWECSPEGEWSFQGRPAPGGVSSVSVRPL